MRGGKGKERMEEKEKSKRTGSGVRGRDILNRML